jgi:hypothetical protein
VIQDPIASANATGAMTFDVNGNLVSPASKWLAFLFPDSPTEPQT